MALPDSDASWVHTLKRKSLREYSTADTYLGVGQADQSYYGGTTLSVFSPRSKKKLLGALPGAILDIEEPEVLLIEIKGGVTVPTHRDHNRSAAINWYIKTNGEYTLFGDSWYDAAPNNMYLMNAQIPHSVTSTGGNRAMVSFSFQSSFQQLASAVS